MGVFFLLQYVIIKRREYLCYAIYLFCLSAYYLVAIPDFFFGISMLDANMVAKYDLFKRPLQFFSSVFYTLFMVYYLGLEKINGFLYKFFNSLVLMYIVLAVVCFLLNHFGVDYNNVYYIFSLLLFPLQLYVVAALFRHKVAYSNYIIWGSIITLVGSSCTLIYYIYLAKYDSANPNANALSYWPVQVSILIDMLLFTIALQRKIADNEKSLINAAYHRQQAILLERERIIADLHDDVGGGLSSIRMMSDLMAQQGAKENHNAYVSFGQKISLTAKDIAQRMHTIIWSLNAENDTVENFAEYVRQYGVSFFENSSIRFRSNNMTALGANIEISGVKRKNLFLIVKEAFHNIIKHSGATEASVNITLEKNELLISIADNGKGITGEDNPTAIRFGNGLKNMQKRMDEIRGKIHIDTGRGTSIKIAVDIN
jgi:signal transduction histidine kinase